MTLLYLLGLTIISIATGCLTEVAFGWLVFGFGLIALSMLAYLDSATPKKPKRTYDGLSIEIDKE